MFVYINLLSYFKNPLRFNFLIFSALLSLLYLVELLGIMFYWNELM